jgi:hypothetical protein
MTLVHPSMILNIVRLPADTYGDKDSSRFLSSGHQTESSGMGLRCTWRVILQMLIDIGIKIQMISISSWHTGDVCSSRSS